MVTTQNGPVRPPLKSAAAPMPEGSVRNKAEHAAQPGEWRDPAVFGPLEDRIRQEERQEKEARKRKPRTAARSPRKRAARTNKPERPVSEALRLGKEMATEAAQRVRAELGDRLSRDESFRVAKTFRSAVVPRRKPGRQPKARITAAFLDWKSGSRGYALFVKHIPGWTRHSIWRRKLEARMLMDAIRSRRRRERD